MICEEGRWYEPHRMETESFELAIRLFCAGLAVNLLIPALKIGRSTRIILGILSGAFLCLALFWHPLSFYFPDLLIASLSALAVNAWAWFGLVMFVAVSTLTRDLMQELKQHSPKTLLLSQKRNGLVIHYAGYGLESGKYEDVTAVLRRCVQDGELSEEVRNQLFGLDPYPNRKKQLLVIYSHGRTVQGHVQIVSEFKRLEIPEAPH